MRKAAPLPPPGLPTLQSAALTYLSRYAATQAGLTRVLTRKIERWARSAEGERDTVDAEAAAARTLIPALVTRLAETGAISDAAFAQSRARSLSRAGRSRRAIGAQLAKSGVPSALARQALPADDRTELAGALIHARKRRMGPWRKTPPLPETARRELASLARAGFAQIIARRALQTTREQAEALIAAFRADL